MPKFLTSLQFRLIIGFAVILALALSSVSVYAHYVADHELRGFAEEVAAIREERLEEMVNGMLASGRSGERLAELVDEPVGAHTCRRQACLLEADDVVHTARHAGASISERFYYRVRPL